MPDVPEGSRRKVFMAIGKERLISRHAISYTTLKIY